MSHTTKYRENGTKNIIIELTLHWKWVKELI